MPNYSAILMDHFQSPRNCGRLENPDHTGVAGVRGSAPFMVLELNVSEDRIMAARFQTFGCGPAIAAGSLFTERIVGLRLQDALRVTEQDVVDGLGGIPEDKLWCAALPLTALRDALDASASIDVENPR